MKVPRCRPRYGGACGMSEPDAITAMFERATAAHRAGDLGAAERTYRALLAQAPGHGAAMGGLGALCFQTQRHEEAAALLADAALRLPDDAQLLANLGAAYASLGRQEAAIDCLHRAVAIAPAHVGAWGNLASLLINADRLAEAERAVERLVALAPADADSIRRRATVRRRLGKFAAAIADYRRALELAPTDARLWSGLGGALAKIDELVAAIAAYREAIRLQPDRAEHHTHLGNVLRKRGEHEAALAAHARAIELAPERVAAHINRGAVLHEMGRNDEALAEFRRATELDPKSVMAWCNAASVLAQSRQCADAIGCYRRALALDPDLPLALAGLLHELHHAADWPGMAKIAPRVDRQTAEALAADRAADESAFANVVRVDDPARNLAIAEAACRQIERRMTGLQARIESRPATASDGRLKVGYVSADFGSHATMHLMRSLFRLHDRRAVEIVAYSTAPGDGSSYRRDAETTVDRFADLSGIEATAAGRRIMADGIDILVDLKGHTGGSRMDVFALRPAPVQVTWLGFPGSTGARFIDYALVDRVVAPPELGRFFTEALCYLPHCYQVTDCEQPIAAEPLSRRATGLPEKAFVFASFNQGYKLDPTMFRVWAELLRSVPHAVLWLWRANEVLEQNIRREAAGLGLRREQLIFAETMPKPLHLRRLALADLALDTRLCNGHTTTSDALWAGLPVVALLGRHFASRVSASVLKAVGLPELVASSLEEYQAIALRYARDPMALRALKAKLTRNRRTEPLFDTPRFARNLERAYRAIWRRHAAGLPPAMLEIEDER